MSLSDKRLIKHVPFGGTGKDCGYCYLEKDLKEFMKELKKKINNKFKNADKSIMGAGWYKVQAGSLLFELDEMLGENFA